MRLFLMRHGSSEANETRSVTLHTPDHAVNLSDKGQLQARTNGAKLARILSKNINGPGMAAPRVRIWNSPYWRTRQTRDGLLESLNKVGFVNSGDGHNQEDPCYDCKESPLLVEQQFGLFDGYEDEELAERFPTEFASFKKNHLQEGRYYARMPMGESRFDVSIRVHQFFGTILRDLETHGIEDVIVVSHGVTLRAFAMMWLHLTPEWFDAEPNPGNCSVRLIEGSRGRYADRGYVVGGTVKTHSEVKGK